MEPGENQRISVSVIVPTYCEAENLPQLIPQVVAALAARDWLWEIIIIDDHSPDNTKTVLETLAATYTQLRFLIRADDRGLSSAVLAGFALARHDYLVVMDADLSHPPESVPALVDPLVENRADFVIGSRNVPGGRTESWGIFRWLNSAVATTLSRPFVGGVKDSMAGFFALRRRTLDSCAALNPIGYKIGLELIVKSGVSRIVEVPIVFRNRTRGQSKLTLAEQFRYLEHLSRLYDYKYPKGSPRVKFLIVAGGGGLSALGILALTMRIGGLAFLPGLALGILGMILVTLLFFIRYVRTQRDFIQMKHPYREFAFISAGEFGAAIITGWVLQRTVGSFHSALAALAVLVVVRYVLRKVFLHDVRGIRGARIDPSELARRNPNSAPAAGASR